MILKTLREIELEYKVAMLERRVLELSDIAGIPGHRMGDTFSPNEKKQIVLSGPIPVNFVAAVDCYYSADPIYGWEIRVMGHPNKAAWELHYQYRISKPEAMDRDSMRYVMDAEHRNFQHCLSQYVLGRPIKSAAA